MSKNLETTKLQYIREHPELSCKEIAEQIGCSLHIATAWRRHFGTKYARHRIRKEREEYLREHYLIDMRTRDIARHFGTSVNVIYSIALRCGLVNDVKRGRL